MFDLLFTYTTVATIAGDSPLSAARLAGIGRHGVVGLPARTTERSLSTYKRSGISTLAVDRHGSPFR